MYNKVIIYGNLWWLSSKESAYSAGDTGSIPGLGRSPGEGNGNPLQFLAWKIPWTEEPSRLHTVHGVARVRHNLATKPPTIYLYIKRETERLEINYKEKKLQKNTNMCPC